MIIKNIENYHYHQILLHVLLCVIINDDKSQPTK